MVEFDPNDENLGRLGALGLTLRRGTQLLDELAARDSLDALAEAAMELDERGKRAVVMVAVLRHKFRSVSQDEFETWLRRQPRADRRRPGADG